MNSGTLQTGAEPLDVKSACQALTGRQRIAAHTEVHGK
jgi:hypothetical protein